MCQPGDSLPSSLDNNTRIGWLSPNDARTSDWGGGTHVVACTMNRVVRGISFKRARRLDSAAVSDLQAGSTDSAYASALARFRERDFVTAQRLCRAILEQNSEHVRSLVLLGDMAQQNGLNRSAVKLLSQALVLDCEDVGAHDTIAIAYEALGRHHDAIRHYRLAIALGLAGVPGLVKQNTAVAAALKRLADAWPRQLTLAELLGPEGATPIASEALLLALLRTRVMHDLELERLLTAIRRGLLAEVAAGNLTSLEDGAFRFYCNLAQQCFLNEYVYALSDRERTQLQTVQARITDALTAGRPAAPLDLIASASYQPLRELPTAEALLTREWPDGIRRLLNQQIRQPWEEKADQPNIPALTSIDNTTSLEVQRQYEENPYPRWTTVPQIRGTTVVNYLWEKLGIEPEGWPRTASGVQILIAGCGTGSHSIGSAKRFSRAQILAIDISRASLAYALRKSRAQGITNVEYAQADILKLGSLERRFDVIEAVGVLHHLSDPKAGWRALVSLLRPKGLMLVGLYSATARRTFDAARAVIAERGYRPTPEDIRACRQELIVRGLMPPARDFSSISGCRDLLFNIMEHRFTIPQIQAFLDANHLKFLGVAQLPPHVREEFRQQFPDPATRHNLAAWQAFEEVHPLTFANMYIFWLQKMALQEGEPTAPFLPPSSPPR
jgi:2-polyprenyl-3-methyl-5-hydroxy-6-metoxy-1,4-benzoquinol methylase/tetratricopeptide (TPR) repeat protein